jgi:hypothetical protein
MIQGRVCFAEIHQLTPDKTISTSVQHLIDFMHETYQWGAVLRLPVHRF